MSTQTVSDTYDVFLSYSLPERPTADLVERALQEAGLRTLSHDSIDAAEDWQDRLWHALVESDAVVVILDPYRPLPSNTGIEIGGAMARHKPLYVVYARNAPSRDLPEPNETAIPQFMRHIPAYSIANVDDLVHSIKRELKSLSEDERTVLSSVYADLGVPSDQLLQEPAATDQLAREFKKRSKRAISGERLVQEIIRLRKSGKLPRLGN